MIAEFHSVISVLIRASRPKARKCIQAAAPMHLPELLLANSDFWWFLTHNWGTNKAMLSVWRAIAFTIALIPSFCAMICRHLCQVVAISGLAQEVLQ